MPTNWDYQTTVMEEELVRDPKQQRVAELVIQHTTDRTYQVLVLRTRHKTWAALVTRRAPHYPRQFMKLEPLLHRLAQRFPYLKEVTLEDLNPPSQVVKLPRVTD